MNAARLPAGLTLLLCLLLFSAGFLAPYPPAEQHRDAAFQPPGASFLLGTDLYGRDQLSRLLVGGRLSLACALLATALSLLIALPLGLIAGYAGGWPDEAIMRFTELFLALPWFYLLLAVRAVLPLSLGPQTAFLLLSALIGCLGWARPARLIRGVALAAREREYVHAARGFGAGPLYLIGRHILPETAGVVLTQAGLLVPQFILAEVTLSFLGLGVAEPAASWGAMLAPLRNPEVVTTYWWTAAPALAILLFLLCWHWLLSAFHAALNP